MGGQAMSLTTHSMFPRLCYGSLIHNKPILKPKKSSETFAQRRGDLPFKRRGRGKFKKSTGPASNRSLDPLKGM